ncbi:MAG TPA: sigma-E factor negative regulatory protein [Woeseiaceae bacterium]
MNDAIRMQISAFVDGELPDNEADLLLRRMGQDAELRRKVGEYLAIGRIMRGESSVAGIERLSDRIAEEIGGRRVDDAAVVAAEPSGRAIRPLAGIAVAASVALVAIFGLQIAGPPDVVDPAPDAATAAASAPETAYTVPRPVDERLLQYFRSHGELSSEYGANGINARLVTLRLSEEALDAEDAAAIEEPATEPRDDAEADSPGDGTNL